MKYSKLLAKIDGKSEKTKDEIETLIGEYVLENFERKEKQYVKLSTMYTHYIKYIVTKDLFPEYCIGKQKFNSILKNLLSKDFQKECDPMLNEPIPCIWLNRPYVRIKNIRLKEGCDVF